MSFWQDSFNAPDRPTRRAFLQRGSLGLTGLAMANGLFAMPTTAAEQQTEKKRRIVRAQIGPSIRIPHSYGDVWTTTWADDDNLYAVADDTTGFNNACNSDLAIQRITGSAPPNLPGVTINPMKEYGPIATFLRGWRRVESRWANLCRWRPLFVGKPALVGIHGTLDSADR